MTESSEVFIQTRRLKNVTIPSTQFQHDHVVGVRLFLYGQAKYILWNNSGIRHKWSDISDIQEGRIFILNYKGSNCQFVIIEFYACVNQWQRRKCHFRGRKPGIISSQVVEDNNYPKHL